MHSRERSVSIRHFIIREYINQRNNASTLQIRAFVDLGLLMAMQLMYILAWVSDLVNHISFLCSLLSLFSLWGTRFVYNWDTIICEGRSKAKETVKSVEHKIWQCLCEVRTEALEWQSVVVTVVPRIVWND